MKDHFFKMKQCGKKFSISEDEWSDLSINKYLNVIVYVGQPYVLGLIKIDGSRDAVKFQLLVNQKLHEFGIDLNTDIVGSTHDGAAIMQKYGRNLKAESHLCYNHAIHLAVVDTFYKDSQDLEDIDEDFDDVDCDDEFSEDDSTSDPEIVGQRVDNNLNFQNDDPFNMPMLNSNIRSVLTAIRKIIKRFRKSNVQNTILQQYMVAQEKKRLRLLLDCQTRWNSLIPMLKRFFLLQNCIKSALNDLGIMFISDEDLGLIEELVKILKPTEVAVKELSSETATLITAEGAFKFLFQKIQQIDGEISLKLATNLRKRMNERRNKTLITLLLYLDTGIMPKTNNNFEYSSKTAAILHTQEIYTRLYPNPNHVTSESEKQNSSDRSIETIDLILAENLEQDLQEAIKSIRQVPQKENTIFNKLKNEFKTLDLTQKRGDILEQIYQALLTIQPTSTANERVFSVAGSFVTKIRSRLNFSSIDALVFLKYYFLHQKSAKRCKNE